MKSKKTAFVKASLLAAIAILAAACSSSGTALPADSQSPFEKFKSRAEFDAYFEWVLKEKGEFEFAAEDGAVSEPGSAGEEQGATPPGRVETNNQSDGVDEGDIIKFAGERLVILRDQHLLVLDIGGGNAATPVVLSDTELDRDFGEGSWGKGAWYDEMLVYDSHIVLVAYRFRVRIDREDAPDGEEYSGAIEILHYRMREDGTLEAAERVFIESNDYYSGATNYAARRIGDRLIIYSPFYVMRHLYSEGGWQREFRIPYVLELVDASQKLFRRTRPAIDYTDAYKGSLACAGFLLHTVYSFEVGDGVGSFASSAVAGDGSHVYYVSEGSFYLNISNWWRGYGTVGESVLYRFSLIGDPRLSALAGIRGSVPERFAMQELDGALMLVAQERGPHALTVRAVELDATDLGSRGESYIELDPSYLTAVRFNGEYAVIAIRHGDGGSIHLADFGGELPAIGANGMPASVTGLLQPYDGNRWLALGAALDSGESDACDFTLRTDLTILKASPSRELEALASFAMEGEFVWSEAFYNDHAFFFDPSRELFAVPYSVWGEEEFIWEDGVQYFSMADGNIRAVEEAVVQTGEDCYECWYGNSRVVRLGDHYYNLLGRQLITSAYDADRVHMAETSSLELFVR